MENNFKTIKEENNSDEEIPEELHDGEPIYD
jgi:hypothetical protein